MRFVRGAGRCSGYGCILMRVCRDTVGHCSPRPATAHRGDCVDQPGNEPRDGHHENEKDQCIIKVQRHPIDDGANQKRLQIVANPQDLVRQRDSTRSQPIRTESPRLYL